ncbi:MAG: FtsW/RodA/SpoVE family cell cycle protein [Candidatus Symbiothrix sp.]|jgi:cell division protein FtsW|nr:FtsW/RodA/SpoVE family cell cycle protein [Candidatus Symbiothrix sp.]
MTTLDFFSKIFRGDRVIWMIFLFLMVISAVEMYSASSTLTYDMDYWQPVARHWMFLAVGLGITMAFHALPPKYFSALGIVLPLTWAGLVAAMFVGSNVNGAHRYIAGFQPSELAKLSLIVLTAWLLGKRKEGNANTIFWWIMGATAVTCALILKENLSTAFILALVVYLMLWIGQMPWKKMLWITVIALVTCGSAYSFIKFTPVEILNSALVNKVLPRADTWQSRLNQPKEDVYSPHFKITDENLQEAHAKIAIANGGIFGKLPGNGIERHILPQAYSDMIYAIIIEELGLIVGGFGVMLLYLTLLLRAGVIARRTNNSFFKLLVMGAGLIIVVQALVNMAVSVGLIMTGQTLPLISRGGTSIWVICVYFGILLSVSRYDNPRGVQTEEAIEEEFQEEQQISQTEQL